MTNDTKPQITAHDLDIILAAINAALNAFEAQYPSRHFVFGFDKDQFEALRAKVCKIA